MDEGIPLSFPMSRVMAPRSAATSMLAARCYPTASFDRLTIISDYYSWLFAFDDPLRGPLLAGASPEEVHAFLCQIYAVIGVASTWGRSTNRVAGPFIAALGDIWSRIEPATTAGWRSRFVRHVTNYIEGCVWEACNRNIERIPSRAVFQCMRSHTSTMYEFWISWNSQAASRFPDAVVEHPMVMELARAANMVAKPPTTSSRSARNRPTAIFTTSSSCCSTRKACLARRPAGAPLTCMTRKLAIIALWRSFAVLWWSDRPGPVALLRRHADLDTGQLTTGRLSAALQRHGLALKLTPVRSQRR